MGQFCLGCDCVKGVFEVADGGAVASLAAEELNDLDRRAEARSGSTLRISIDSTVWMPLSAYLSSRASSTARALLAVLAEDVALLHVVGALLAGERRLVEGDVADEVEGVVVAADLFGQLVEEHALGVQLLDDGLLLVGGVPACEEVVEGGESLVDGLAGVVRERLGDELAVGVEVLDALGGDADFDVVDVVAPWRSRLVSAGANGWRRIDDGAASAARPHRVRWIVRRDDGVVRAGLVDLDGIAVEVGVGEQLGGPLEVHDGEEELAVVLVDAGAAADDLLELGHAS